jgi:hypothetical protein
MNYQATKLQAYGAYNAFNVVAGLKGFFTEDKP